MLLHGHLFITDQGMRPIDNCILHLRPAELPQASLAVDQLDASISKFRVRCEAE